MNDLYNGSFDYKISFNDSWYHISKKNSSHDAHNHRNCSWCGIFYVDPGDINKGGNTIFMNPIVINFKDISNNFIDSSLEIVAQKGKLVLFPSYLQHYQSLYTGDEKRIVIGFNMKILDRV